MAVGNLGPATRDPVGGVPTGPHARSHPRKRRDGLRVRLSRARGLTPKGILESPIWLPVVLGDFTVNEGAAHTDYETHRRGEFSVPGQGGGRARMLRSTDLDSMTLDWDATWLTWYRNPHAIKKELRKILHGKRPVKLLAQNYLSGRAQKEEVRMLVTLRDTTRTLKPGEPDARYWTLEIREYRRHSVRRLQNEESRGFLLPMKHKLRESDTLIYLSKHYYGFHWGWRDIRDANGLSGFGARTEIVKSEKFKKEDLLNIPKKPTKHAEFLSPRAGEIIDEGPEIVDLLHPPTRGSGTILG